MNCLRLCFDFMFSSSKTHYQNPVISPFIDSADPGVIVVNGAFYVAVTGGWEGNYFRIFRSDNGTNFERVGQAFKVAPEWTTTHYWAPEIHVVNNQYVMYYSAAKKGTVGDKLCIGAAFSNKVEGPYKDIGKPLIELPEYRAIDATLLKSPDDSKLYIVYKAETNNIQHNPTIFYAKPLTADGLSAYGQPVQIFRNDHTSWQNDLVEGQWFVREGGYYYLFYSAGGVFNTPEYSVGVARSKHFLGPYVRYDKNPILHTRKPIDEKSWLGPGHCSVVQKGGKWFMFYHAWPPKQLETIRILLMDEVKFVDGWPRMAVGETPSQVPQIHPNTELSQL